MARYRLVTTAGSVLPDQEFEGAGTEGAAIEGTMRAIRHRLAATRTGARQSDQYVLQVRDGRYWRPVRLLTSGPTPAHS